MVSNCLTINHFSFQYSCVPASRRFVFDESVCWFITRTQEFQVKHFLDLHCLAWDGVVMVLLHVLCLYDSDKNKSKSWQFRMITLCWFGFFFILCCLEGLWGHWVEYTVWVCNSAYRNRSLLKAYFKLRCEPDYLKEHDKLLFVLLGFGLTKSPLVWFGHIANLLQMDK